MKKIICTLIVLVMVLSSATVFADGRRGHYNRGGGVNFGEALAITAGVVVLGTVLSNIVRENAPVQYVPVQQYAPAPVMYYQQVQVQPPSFVRGTCFPRGGYFPDGVNVVGMGYFPAGTQVPPGFCFQ